MDKKDIEYYEKEYDRLESIRSASEDLREERTFDIASGGLALSIGIFVYLTANEKPLQCKWIIILVMICFGLAIVLNYISHYESVRVMERNIGTVDKWKGKREYDAKKLQKRYDKRSCFLSLLNWVVFALTIIGVCFIVVYGIGFVI